MSVIEFIGFVITMIVFFILILKQGRNQRRRREHPEEFEEEFEQQETMQELMESLNVRLEKKAPPKQPPPPPTFLEEEKEEDRRLIEAERLRAEEMANIQLSGKELVGKKDVFTDVYAGKESLQPHHEEGYVKWKKQRSRVQKKLKEPDSLKEAIILREILGPPKGM